jgi:hypothetical protein
MFEAGFGPSRVFILSGIDRRPVGKISIGRAAGVDEA